MGWLVQLNHQLDGNEEMGSEKNTARVEAWYLNK